VIVFADDIARMEEQRGNYFLPSMEDTADTLHSFPRTAANNWISHAFFGVQLCTGTQDRRYSETRKTFSRAP